MKKIAILVASLLLVSSLNSCGKKKSVDELMEENYQSQLQEYVFEEEAEEEGVDLDSLSASGVTGAFITAVIEGDITTAYSLIDIEDDTFFSEEVFEYVLKRSDFSWVVRNSDVLLNNYNTNITRNTAISYVELGSVSGDYQEIELNLILNDDSHWKIDSNIFAMHDITINVPIGTRFFLDEEEVSHKYISDHNSYYDIYKIPMMGRKSWKTHVLSSLFGESESEITINYFDDNEVDPTLNVKTFSIISSISDMLFDEVSDYLKNAYEKIYKSAENGEDFSTLSDLFSPNIEAETLKPVYQKALDSTKDENVNDIRVVGIDSLEDYPSFITSESEIVMNVGVHTLWYDSSGHLCESARMTACQLEKVDNNWYICDIRPNVFVYFENGDIQYTISSLQGYQ